MDFGVGGAGVDDSGFIGLEESAGADEDVGDDFFSREEEEISFSSGSSVAGGSGRAVYAI